MPVQSLRPRFQQFRGSIYFPFRLLIIIGAILLVCISGSAALAQPAVSIPGSGLQFTQQMRIGFHSGDDWEPSITTDRYGHVYALYKHYDVQGGGTCSGCDRHLLVQRSDDEGKTWSAPRPIAPGPVTGGQYDPQIMVDPADGRTVWASFLENAKSKIAVVKSTDFGQTWSPLQIVSDNPPGLDKDELAVRGNLIVAIAVGQSPGDVRLAWMDTRTGKWNVFFRESTDGGQHLTSTVRISGYVPGYPYLTQAGFDLPYGDYQSMAIDSDNNTQMAFGEGPSYQGPGNQWVSHNINK